MSPSTLFEKIWADHVIDSRDDGWALLHIDRLLLHDLSGNNALSAMAERGLHAVHPELSFSTPDHAVSTMPGRTARNYPMDSVGATLRQSLMTRSQEQSIRFFDVGEIGHGIVHVMGPETGIVLPGATVICGDSHTCTNGGLGALAFGVGSSELTHALATQTLWQRKPKTMRVSVDGDLAPGVAAKDVILHIISLLGARGGTDYAIEYAGSTIRNMEIEARLTLCNLSIELGAKFGMVAPDEKTFAYIEGRALAPKGEVWQQALTYWRTLRTDDLARFDHDIAVDAADIEPMMTWGTSPEHVVAVGASIPVPADAPDDKRRDAWQAAQEYMGLTPGAQLVGTPVDWVFIGSCTNARLSDLRVAADIVRGKHVAEGVTAWVVPGSEQVKRDAIAEGLDRVFVDAGFAWREPGCSLCVGANGDQVPPEARCVSTSNRNFVGRQGPHARTHLASPSSAAAAALAGVIVDIRSFSHA